MRIRYYKKLSTYSNKWNGLYPFAIPSYATHWILKDLKTFLISDFELNVARFCVFLYKLKLCSSTGVINTVESINP